MLIEVTIRGVTVLTILGRTRALSGVGRRRVGDRIGRIGILGPRALTGQDRLRDRLMVVVVTIMVALEDLGNHPTGPDREDQATDPLAVAVEVVAVMTITTTLMETGMAGVKAVLGRRGRRQFPMRSRRLSG